MQTLKEVIAQLAEAANTPPLPPSGPSRGHVRNAYEDRDMGDDPDYHLPLMVRPGPVPSHERMIA